LYRHLAVKTFFHKKSGARFRAPLYGFYIWAGLASASAATKPATVEASTTEASAAGE